MLGAGASARTGGQELSSHGWGCVRCRSLWHCSLNIMASKEASKDQARAKRLMQVHEIPFDVRTCSLPLPPPSPLVGFLQVLQFTLVSSLQALVVCPI